MKKQNNNKIIICCGKLLFFSSIITTFISCNTINYKNEKTFGYNIIADQNFKTAIYIIETHKVRNGKYPKNIGEIKYLGFTDSIAFDYVDYKRCGNGYELNMKKELIDITGDTLLTYSLHYTREFWKGLGIVKSNLMEYTKDSL